jgi:dTDP-glucose pyrophosphorylase
MNERLQTVTVRSDASIREAMEAIDRGGVEIALVTDDGRLLATASDGDIRRALLSGMSIDDPISACANPTFTAVGPESDRSWVLDLMQARHLAQIPVIDEDGQLVGLHIMGELIAAESRAQVAVVMAGGRGVRLNPLTEDRPKPMLTVAGRPILERIVLHLVGSGIKRIFIAVNYLASLVEDHFQDGSHFGCTISYLREDPDVPLGTAGALTLLPTDVLSSTEPILLMNGDLVTQFSVSRMLEHHQTERSVLTVGVREFSSEIPFGVIETSGDRVVGIREKPTQVWLVSAGIYVVSPLVLRNAVSPPELPMTELIASCIQAGEKVGTFAVDGEWVDVGRFGDLNRARGL